MKEQNFNKMLPIKDPIFEKPLIFAKSDAVFFSVFFIFGSLPFKRRNITISSFPLLADSWRGI